MPVYFEMKSEAHPITSRASADAWSEILQDAIEGLDVRVVPIKKGRHAAYIYACAARRRPVVGAIVACLRSDGRLRNFEFSDEAETSEGPFRWSTKH